MIFHFTVNGVPACAAEETLDPRISPTTCSHETRESAEWAIERVKKWYPDAEFEVVPGRCPRPDAYDKYADQEVKVADRVGLPVRVEKLSEGIRVPQPVVGSVGIVVAQGEMVHRGDMLYHVRFEPPVQCTEGVVLDGRYTQGYRLDELTMYPENSLPPLRQIDVDQMKDNVRKAVDDIISSYDPFSKMDGARPDFDLSYDEHTEAITMHPHNLFTGLLLLGRYVPKAYGVDEYTDDFGTTFRFTDDKMLVCLRFYIK